MTTLEVAAPVAREARAVLAVRARSFRWGAVFLPADVRDDAAVLYAFCRLADDLADDAPDPVAARHALDALRAELVGDRPPRPVVAAFRGVLARRGPGPEPALDLIGGVASDLGTVRIPDDAALLRYCYAVAGTVGLLMCGLLGVRDPAAREPAIALGQAMQLTNICRDVAEDAGLGRVYLPASRLAAVGVTPDDVLARRGGEGIARVVADLLALAEERYRVAEVGMGYIPARTRLAIFVAARLYRAIGGEIRRRGCDPWAGRAVVPPWRKTFLAAGALAAFVGSLR